MTKPLYVGELKFASYKEAQAYCKQAGLSPTLIHHHPLKLKNPAP